MNRLTFVLLLLSLQASRAATPQLFCDKDFSAATFAEAVNHFVRVGENSAIEELRALASEHGIFNKQGFSRNERVGWMCRVLFEPKGGEPLRPPGFGALNLPSDTMPLKNWPLYPVAHSGSTYFVLSEGYQLSGKAEDPKGYIEYCHQSSIFRSKAVPVPTRAQALKDAASLRQSTEWTVIKWNVMGWYWEKYTWNYIQNQAESIPQ